MILDFASFVGKPVMAKGLVSKSPELTDIPLPVKQRSSPAPFGSSTTVITGRSYFLAKA